MADNTEHATLKALHAHLRHFHIKQANYYEQYFPRADKLTNEKIPFKDYNQYFSTDFANQNNFKKWIKLNPVEGQKWVVDRLIKRKTEKGLKFAPSEIELRLQGLPSILWIDLYLPGGYSRICQDIGLPSRYSSATPTVDLGKPLDIIEDTREQKGLKFSAHIKVSRQKLEYGDIALASSQLVAVERKSLVDLCGTISAGYERFTREIERAKDDGGYLVVCVEESFDNFKSISYLPHTKHVKASYSFLAHRIREICEKFDNVQFCFCDGRPHMARVVEFVLKTGDSIRTIDLQLLIDSKGLL
jgi:hypothetical protein